MVPNAANYDVTNTGAGADAIMCVRNNTPMGCRLNAVHFLQAPKSKPGLGLIREN